MADDEDLRLPLARLYDLEREERNERRGLEQRAATTFAASLVVLGLAVNALKDEKPDGEWLTVGVGAAMTLVGALIATFGLAGVHTTSEGTIRAALRWANSNRPVTVEPYPLTQAYVDDRVRRLSGLTKENVKLVPLLRMANLLLGLGAYFILVGVAVVTID